MMPQPLRRTNIYTPRLVARRVIDDQCLRRKTESIKNLIDSNSADGGAHARALQCVIHTVSQPDLGRVPQRKPFPDLPHTDDTADELFP